MSRIARRPLSLPAGVEVKQEQNTLTVKGKKGVLSMPLHRELELKFEGNSNNVVWVTLKSDHRNSKQPMLGTTRVLLENLVKGVNEGYEVKLLLVGVGYRAKAQGRTVELTIGLSHLVNYEAPEGISLETPSNTEILVKGINKQVVGQVAAEIRAYRSPESYKGKGIRYSDEVIVLKETKKGK
ncbi:MAG: 50S ribosomal protein L6 [Gammaproteobacteria bacterium]